MKIFQKLTYIKNTISNIKLNGLDPYDVMYKFANDLSNCKYIVGHNIISFDIIHLKKYCLKYNIKLTTEYEIIDTMRICKPHIKTLNKIGKIKNPSLAELVNYYCPIALNANLQHVASYDVWLTANVFEQLLKNKIITNFSYTPIS